MAKFRQQTDSHQKLVLASEVTRRIRRILDAIVGAAGVQDEVRTEALEAVMMAIDAVNSQPRRPGQRVKDTHLLATSDAKTILWCSSVCSLNLATKLKH